MRAPVMRVTCRRLAPSASLTQTWSLSFWLAKSAIFLPSGEYIGHHSRPSERRNGRSSPALESDAFESDAFESDAFESDAFDSDVFASDALALSSARQMADTSVA